MEAIRRGRRSEQERQRAWGGQGEGGRRRKDRLFTSSWECGEEVARALQALSETDCANGCPECCLQYIAQF